MTDKSIDKFKREMEMIINNRLTADMVRARNFLFAKLNREPTRHEITLQWISEKEKIFEFYSGNKEAKMAAFKEEVRKFWEARHSTEAKR